MKLNYIILGIVFCFALVCCKTNKGIDSEARDIPSFNDRVKIDSFLFNSDGVFIHEAYFRKSLSCYEAKIKSKDSIIEMSTFAVHNYVDDCIKEKVFRGDLIAEPFLVGFLHQQKNKLFPYKPEKYRGSNVFLTLLELASSIECSSNEWNTPYGRSPLDAIIEMTKSFEGYSNFKEFKKNTSLLSQVEKKSFKDFTCRGVASIRINYLLIKKAWENNLIVLKDYGEP